MDEEKVCQVCSDFEPQAWRKSLCRNCFHTFDNHSEELLAAEAEAVAKEKAAENSAKVAKEVKGSSHEGGSTPKHVASKFGTGDRGDSKLYLLSKDLGLEYGKPRKPPQKDLDSAQDPSTSTTSAKSSMKSSASLSSSPSSSSKTTTATTTTDAQPKSSSISKTKNFASKFEKKKSEDTSQKHVKKPVDIRGSSTSVSALTGKLSKESVKSQTTEESQTAAPKLSDSKSKLSSPSSKTPPSKSATNGVDKSIRDEKDKKNDKDLFPHSRSKAAPFGKDLLKSTTKDIKSHVSTGEKDNVRDVSLAKMDSSLLGKSKDLPTSKTGSLKYQTTGLSDNKLESMKTEDKAISGSGREESTPKPLGKTNASPMTSNLGQSTPTESKSSVPSPSHRPEDPEDSAIVNNTGQLAKFLPGTDSSAQVHGSATGKTGLGKIVAKPVKGTARVTGAADGTKKDQQTSNADSATNSNSGGTASVEGKKFEQDKTALSRDRDKSKGGGNLKKTGDKIPDAADTPFSQSLNEAAVSSSTSKTTVPPSSPTISSAPSSPTRNPETSPSNISKRSDATKPKDLRVSNNTGTSSSLNKLRELEKKLENKEDRVSSPLKSASICLEKKDDAKNTTSRSKSAVDKSAVSGPNNSDQVADTLRNELKEKETSLQELTSRLDKMEDELKNLKDEKEKLKKEAIHTRQSQKYDTEKLLKELQKMETQCDRLQTDNISLLGKLHVQEESVRKDQEIRGKNVDNVHLEEDLEVAEQELENVKDDNQELQRQIMEMKNEMDEMYDSFRENEHDEFREVQKELDMTAKNCRILQFKLRKAERRNDQVEEDRVHYEEKLRMLQNQFDSQDAKNHIHLLEEELRLAKDVSVRLHDELDIVEDKKNKALEENRHLTEMLEHTDKRQFRLEMEIDKLRDLVQDLKMELREAKGGNNNNNNDGSSERKVPSYIITRSLIEEI